MVLLQEGSSVPREAAGFTTVGAALATTGYWQRLLACCNIRCHEAKGAEVGALMASASARISGEQSKAK